MLKQIKGLMVAVISIFVFNSTYACTNFTLKSKDGTYIVARTMEFAMALDSDIVSQPIGTQFKNTAPNGSPAMSWQTKYGYVLVDGLHQIFTVDGMNTEGLAFEYLYLPGETKYQTVPTGKESQAIPYYYFGDWVLGNFKTVQEVRDALNNIFVYEQAIPGTDNIIFPLHAAIHDNAGNGIVVEFIDGKLQVSDYVGVMTNSPTYQWHVSNLKQYIHLSPFNPAPVISRGISYGATGEGAGMLGLPGDISPPSRFVKMAFLLQYAYPVENSNDAVNLAQHIINNVDIPLGVSRVKTNDKITGDLTQWSVFKDLKNKVMYFHSYGNLNLRSVDLKAIDFSKGAPQLIMPIASKQVVTDVTSQLKPNVS